MFKIDNIDFTDSATYDMICSGNTGHCFQLESHLGRHWSRVIKPRSIKELSDIIALIRPSCLQAKIGNKTMTQLYADRKHGKEQIPEYNPIFDEIVKDTYGIMLYQEQSIFIAQKIAGFDLNKADILRKAIGRKDPELMSQLEQEFVDGCKDTNIASEEQAKEIFSWIRASQRYQFNLSHSISYSINAFKTCYCKCHYPLQFYTAYLQGCRWKQKPREATKQLIIDGRSNNIEFSPPSIIDLQINPYIKKKKYVAFGLASIRDIGESARQNLIDYIKQAENELGRTIDSWTWTDFLITLCHSINKRYKIGSKVSEALIFSGALDCFGVTRHKMQFDYEMFGELTQGIQKFIVSRHLSFPFNSLQDAVAVAYPTKKNGGGAHTQKVSDKTLSVLQALKNPAISMDDDPKFLALSEEKYLGIAISCSKGDGTIQSNISNYTCKALAGGSGNKNITFVAEVARFKVVKTKNGDNPGQPMAFIDFYDQTGGLEGCVAFPGAWSEIEDIINEDDAYYILCSRTKQNSISVEKMEKIT